MNATKPDGRDGSVSDINVQPMPIAQQHVFDQVPTSWRDMPRIGISDMFLRSLKDRGLVETRWRTMEIRQWRRAPKGEA